MKKPNIDKEAKKIMVDRELHEEMIDALIETKKAYQGVGDFESTGVNMAEVITFVDKALKKAGCTNE